jgi:UDP-N-acetylglucosamine 2-epimerase
MKLLSVVGTRPELIQAMPLSLALRPDNEEVMVHTDQHTDPRMSEGFFEELGLPAAKYHLGVEHGPDGRQTAEMMSRLEDILLAEQPELVIVRGDTNSTLAGALAASRLSIPVAHIEAGERTFDRRMPEELNRMITDHVSQYHFCTSRRAVRHLASEGIIGSVYWVGDVLLDALHQMRAREQGGTDVLDRLRLRPREYALVTVHRAENIDDPARLRKIVQTLNLANEPVVFPVHPRTSRSLRELGATFRRHVRLIEPLGFVDMISLESHARLIATDSGGVQREAYYLGVPCLTFREKTEWSETVEAGWNRVVGIEPDRALEVWHDFEPPTARPALYGDGRASHRITALLRGDAVDPPGETADLAKSGSLPYA